MQVSGKENILTNRHQSTDELLFIPVIIHVVYHENAEDLSIEQINSQISVLNKDFRANNVDLINLEELFEGFEADVNLEFFLADTLLNTGYYGIHKISTEQSVSTPDNLFSSDSGGADPIDPDKFLNIWVANLSEGLLGFNGVEGIAVDYTHFGTMGTVSDPYDLGRTLTHELGHYFSLDHLWGTGGCESDDGIEDTPNQASSVNSCDQEIISCGSTDMVQNFMNLSTDECLLFFTEGQKSKMRKYLYEQKPNLIQEKANILFANKENTVKKVAVFPNPSANRVVSLKNLVDGVRNLSISSIDGKYVKKNISQVGLQQSVLDLSGLESGLYLLNIVTNQSQQTIKIILK